MEINSLKKDFSNWIDIDFAQYILAKHLGIIDPDSTFIKTKHLYWSDNEIGSKLIRILDFLVEQKLLIKRDEPDFQYQWKDK